MSRPFDFCERDVRPFFSIFGSLLYSSSHLFLMWLLSMLWCWLTITHFFYLFVSFYFCSITLFHFTSSDFFFFSSYLMFDCSSTSTLYSCLFDVSIPLSLFFAWGSLGPRLMTFSMHCISYMRGIRIISLRSLSLVSFRFFHHMTLAYVTSCVLRPPWGPDFILCLTAHTQAILEIGWRWFLKARWMMSYDMIYTEAYPSYQWWIFRGDVIYTGAYLIHRWQFLLGWCLALGHS